MSDDLPNLGDQKFALSSLESRNAEISLVAFDDNLRTAELAGERDANLILIEQMLGVRIDPRGNRFAISGPEDSRTRAVQLLRTLYKRLVSGQPVSSEEVRAAARLAPSVPDRPQASGAVQSIKTPKRLIQARTAAQRIYLDALAGGELVFGVGPAGTGKTYLAVAHAVSLLLSGAVDRIVLSRPALEAGERIGFLPGDLKEKVDPYLRPLYDALYDMLPGDYVERRILAGDIEIAPLAFMRGRTLARSAIILDEAQNATVAQTKMFLTRLGEGSRMTLTGDPTQSDLPRGDTSGLADALGLLAGVPGVRAAHFTAADVVRHPLVGHIIAAYEARTARQNLTGGAK